ncbi:MAG TPA: triose-phosphate isomerase [Candidatus Eremiobacteraceae bacterium]
MRQLICAGNWKMHKTGGEAAAFVDAFLPLARAIPERVEIVLCPPFTALAAVSPKLDGGRVRLGAQDVHWDESGAFTGAISAPMLREYGVQYVIVGHSERREYFGDTDLTVRLKTVAALAAGLTPIVAVGETIELRDAGKTLAHVTLQTRAALDGLSPADLARVVLAYEPIWAIGTGRSCDPAEANAVMAAIRACVPGLRDAPILYGGSVKPDNIAEYTVQPEIDGGLVGGASLDPASFAALCANASG